MNNYNIQILLLIVAIVTSLVAPIPEFVSVILLYGLLFAAGYLLPYPSWKTGSLMASASIVAGIVEYFEAIILHGVGWKEAILGEESFPLIHLLWTVPIGLALMWCSAVLFVFLGSLLRKRMPPSRFNDKKIDIGRE